MNPITDTGNIYWRVPTLSMMISISSVISSCRSVFRRRQSSYDVRSKRRTAASMCCMRRWFSAIRDLYKSSCSQRHQVLLHQPRQEQIPAPVEPRRVGEVRDLRISAA